MESRYLFPEENENPLEDTYTRMEMLELVATAMKALTPEERELILNLYYRGRSEREISEEWHIAHTTIHSRKKAVLRKLRDFVERFI